MKRYILAAALAALFAGTANAADTEFVLYKQPDFRGPSHTVKGEVNILENGFAGQAESLEVRGGYWEACTEDRFKGTCRVLAAGQYPRLTGDINRKIVSVRFLGNDPKIAQRVERESQAALNERDHPRHAAYDRGSRRHGAIELYGREGFNGRSIRVEESVDDLANRRFDGRASSLIVEEGTWQVCSRPGYEGTCRTFGPGEYSRLAGLDDRINSIRQVR